MKIGFDAKRAFHNFRGLGNYSRLLIDGLTQYYPQDELHLYTPAFNDRRIIDWSLKHEDLKIHLPQGKISQTIPSIWRSFFLANDLKNNDLDIYHGLSHELPSGIEKLNLKSIVTMHDVLFMRYPQYFPWVDRQVYKRKFLSAVGRADVVVAICEQTKRDLIDFLGVPEKKIVVHYQSCDPHFYSAFSEDKILAVRKKYHLPEKFILNVGAIEKRKNTMALVEAFNNIKNDICEDLVLVGNGGRYKEEILEFIKKHSLGSRVHVISGVSYADLPGVYQAAKLFCFPSFFEGFGIPLIESLFSNTPVVVSTGSCFPETVGPDAYFIDPYKTESIEVGLKEMLENDDLRQSKIISGNQYVQKFHLENSTKEIRAIYEMALKN